MANDWEPPPWPAVDKCVVDMRPGPDSLVWHLGCDAKSVTISRQQARAIELVDYFVSKNEEAPANVRPFRKIAVVGGGIAGLTLASAAATEGIAVTLLEKRNTFMGALRRSNRHVAPHINDWPYANWHRRDSGCRVLEWQTQPVGRVVTELRRQWGVICEAYEDAIQVRRGANVVELCPPDGRAASISLKTSAPCRTLGPFDAVILAVGFGRERVPPWDDVNQNSYWYNDRLDQDQDQPDGNVREKRVLIFGTGDGAIAELLRATLQDFGIDTLLEWALALRDRSPKEHRNLAQMLCASEERMRAVQDPAQASRLLADEYDEIARDGPSLPAYVSIGEKPNLHSKSLLELRDPPSRVILSGQLPTPLDPRAAIINRFALHRLWRLNTFEYVLSSNTVQLDSGKFYVPEKLYDKGGNDWKDINRLRWGDSEAGTRFDHVIYRTGAKRTLEEDFPAYWAALK